MTCIRLPRAEGKRRRYCPTCHKHTHCKRSRLDRVAKRRARAMRLDRPKRSSGQTSVRERCSQQHGLRLAIRSSKTRTASILPHCAPLQHKPHIRAARCMQCHHGATLASCKSIGTSVKRVRPTAWRSHTSNGERVAGHGQKKKIDSRSEVT